MYSRDYILKLVQLFAQVLARIMGLKEKGDLNKATEVINEAYISLFGLKRFELLELNFDQIIPMLKDRHKLSNEHLEVLAKLMVEDAAIAGGAEKTDLFRKSLFILEYLNVEQKIYSFEREKLIEKIKENIHLN
jgi:hypothetical protein